MNFSKGKVYGIVGENGAGKTTLFRCIAGLEDYQGEINSEFIPLKNHLGLLLTEPSSFQKSPAKNIYRLLCNARGKAIIILRAEIFLIYPITNMLPHIQPG